MMTERKYISSYEKKLIAARQSWKCNTCNTLLPACFEIDHLDELCDGGDDTPANRFAVCVGCHGDKTQICSMKRVYDRYRRWGEQLDHKENELKRKRSEMDEQEYSLDIKEQRIKCKENELKEREERIKHRELALSNEKHASTPSRGDSKELVAPNPPPNKSDSMECYIGSEKWKALSDEERHSSLDSLKAKLCLRSLSGIRQMFRLYVCIISPLEKQPAVRGHEWRSTRYAGAKLGGVFSDLLMKCYVPVVCRVVEYMDTEECGIWDAVDAIENTRSTTWEALLKTEPIQKFVGNNAKNTKTMYLKRVQSDDFLNLVISN